MILSKICLLMPCLNMEMYGAAMGASPSMTIIRWGVKFRNAFLDNKTCERHHKGPA